MPYLIEAKCPCCKKVAYGVENIERDFGWRDAPRKGQNQKHIPQSYCRECRIAGCKAGEPCKVKSKV